MKALLQHKHLVIVSAILLLECLRHFAMLSLGPVPLVLDSSEYWITGQIVADGDLLQATVDAPYRTPVYPYYLAVYQAFFGEKALLSCVIVQHLAVLATTLLMCWAAARLCRNRGAALVCYLLLFPFLTRVWYANATLTESLFALPFAAGIAALLMYEDRRPYKFVMASGFLLGLATVIRPVPQLLVPAFAVAMALTAKILYRRENLSTTMLHAFLFFACFGLILAPCFARNKIIYDKFFLTNLPAANKWAVTFRGGSGGDLPWPVTANAKEMEKRLNVGPGILNDRHAYTVRDQLIESGLSVEETEDLMTRVSFDAIRANKLQFAWKALKRIVNYWRCTSGSPPFARNVAPDFQDQFVWKVPSGATLGQFLISHTPTQSLWWNQIFSLVSWCAAGILLFNPNHRWKGIVLLMTFSYFCLLTGLVEIENYQYRMILEPIMVLGIVIAFLPCHRPNSGIIRET